LFPFLFFDEFVRKDTKKYEFSIMKYELSEKSFAKWQIMLTFGDKF